MLEKIFQWIYEQESLSKIEMDDPISLRTVDENRSNLGRINPITVDPIKP